MKPGYYWIEHEGKAVPSHFDGKKFTVNGRKTRAAKRVIDPAPIALSCPSGCTCTQNADGSISVKCSNT